MSLDDILAVLKLNVNSAEADAKLPHRVAAMLVALPKRLSAEAQAGKLIKLVEQLANSLATQFKDHRPLVIVATILLMRVTLLRAIEVEDPKLMLTVGNAFNELMPVVIELTSRLTMYAAARSPLVLAHAVAATAALPAAAFSPHLRPRLNTTRRSSIRDENNNRTTYTILAIELLRTFIIKLTACVDASKLTSVLTHQRWRQGGGQARSARAAQDATRAWRRQEPRTNVQAHG